MVLSVLFIVILIACLAFAVDLGYLCLARSQAQNAADAAALAAAGRLLDDRRIVSDNWYEVDYNARTTAVDYAARNPVGGASPLLDRNDANEVNGDLVIGRRTEGGDLSIPEDWRQNDSVYVRIRGTAETHGPVTFFFARALGTDSMDITAEAIATFNGQVGGFRPTANTGNSSLIPFAIHIDGWRDLLAGNTGADNYAVDPETNEVWNGSDGIPEFQFFPNATTAGNFGTIKIGDSSNGTSELIEQIVNGASEADAAFHGGEIGLGTYSGDPGVSAAIKAGFEVICGQPRTVLLYDGVTGTGSNTQYSVVGFAGVRVVSYWMEATTDLETKKKFRVVLQPAVVVDNSAVSGPGQDFSVYQPVALTR